MNDSLYEFAAAVGTFGEVAGEALRDMINRIAEAGKPVIKSFNDLYNELAVALGNEETKKRLRQQSIRDKRQQLERSRKRQQLLEQNRDKSNNWKRLHGLPAARKSGTKTKESIIQSHKKVIETLKTL